MEWQSRTTLLLGEEKIKAINNKHVLIVGIGGVGAYVAEMLCRAGIGELSFVDDDDVSDSNKNRQLIALDSTINKSKSQVLKARLLDINPELKIHAIEKYFTQENADEILGSYPYNYVCDCIDTLSPKIFLIKSSLEWKLPLVSSLGTGGKMDVTQVKITDISESYNCRLGTILRKRLHRINIYTGFKVVFSVELIDKKSITTTEGERNKKSNVGTISYMPPLFGIYMASEVIKSLISEK